MVPAQNTTMPPRFTTKHETGKVASPGCSNTHIDIDALAGDLPDRLAEIARLFQPVVVFGRADLGHLAPAFEVLAVDHALGAERHDEVALVVVGHDADGIGAGGGDELHRHRAETARGAPHQHVMAGLQRVRAMAEQHAIGGGERERVAGGLLPGEMLRPLQKLAVLHARELSERAVRGLVAPDALRGGEHRIAAVTFLVVAVILIAVDHDLVADLPALHL